MGEVKTFIAVMRDGANPNTLNAPAPASPAATVALGGTVTPDACHTRWVNGIIIHIGLSATLTPNKKVMFTQGGQPYDVNFTTSRLGLTTKNLTYVATTSRSFHPGGVNTGVADGSVRFVKDTIALATWRALGTRGGDEIIGANSF